MSGRAKAKAKAKARSRTAGGYRDGRSMFSAVALLQQRREAEALLSADDRARNARVRRMDEELAGELRAEEVRRAAVAKQAAFRDAVRGMSVGAADALLAGKTLDDLDAYAGQYHRRQWAAAVKEGRHAMTALELAPHPSHLAPQLAEFVLNRTADEAQRAANAPAAAAAAAAATHRRVLFLCSRAAADAIHLTCLRAIPDDQRPDGFNADGTPSGVPITTIHDIRLYLQHV